MIQKDKTGISVTIKHNETVQPNDELLNRLKTAIPQFFDKDNNFKADKFEAELIANNIIESRDGYKLGFVGKDYARMQVGLKSETMIVPDCKHNSRPENAKSGNIFITGDNIDALRHLVNAYENKIKLIYIDPPYNTGKEFTYSDKFEFSDDKLKTILGYSDEEVTRLKSIQGKSSHSAWLTFIYPRLKIAQRLLKDDGVIFVSIDDNEQANLKLLMDDVFGEGNFSGYIIWQTATDNNPTQIATEHEYILCYAKSINEQDYWEIPSDKGKIIQEKYIELKKENINDINMIQTELRKWIRKQNNGIDLSGVSHYSYVDEKGVYYPGNSANTKPGGYDYDIIHPKTNRICAKPQYGYRFTFDTFQKADLNGDVQWGEDESIIPKIKKRIETVMEQLKSYYYEDNRGTTAQLRNLFDGIKVFDNPKSVDLLLRLSKFLTKDDDLILDFFAGSATTAHAVMQLNAEDGGNRKFIMVQLDEETKSDSEARKANYNTIDEIARDRIKRAGKKILAEYEGDLVKRTNGWDKDIGFKHYRLVLPKVTTIDKIKEFNPDEPTLIADDMITPFEYKKTETNGLDTLLTTWMIDDGFSFDTEVEEVIFSVYKAHYVREAATLYLIDQDWNTSALKDMLNQIGTNKLPVATIVVYPYSFKFEAMRELKTNIKTNLDNPPNLIERY